MWRLLFDENVSSRRIAVPLMELGHYVLPLQDRHHLRGAPDKPILEWCFEQELVVVAKNRRDFEDLNRSYQDREDGQIHAGIIAPDWKVAEIPRILAAYLAANDPNELVNSLAYLLTN